ncbi:hypothetical protein [Thermosyntropha sp.]|uniref:hypothetical protein n=1 Tax=Thermosyntropha sp. TaxID=2740820 RepID=UPI0025E855E5|nr:hypothetical protein [Thermosyntropha sp.]MBO8159120.1 hypothetical protein [Thermosyntropha sp.]
MTEMQQVFLFYTFVYFLVKGAIYIAIYIATIIIEKKAREKHALLQAYLTHKRADEKQRWQVAYALYNKRHKKTKTMWKKAA